MTPGRPPVKRRLAGELRGRRRTGLIITAAFLDARSSSVRVGRIPVGSWTPLVRDAAAMKTIPSYLWTALVVLSAATSGIGTQPAYDDELLAAANVESDDASLFAYLDRHVAAMTRPRPPADEVAALLGQ